MAMSADWHNGGHKPPMQDWELHSSIPDRFRRVAAHFPQQTAIVSESEAITYEALDRASDVVAAELLAAGEPGAGVVILLQDQDIALYRSILGVLKAGKIYLAVHPQWPLEQQQKLIAKARGRVVLTGGAHKARALALAPSERFVIDAGTVAQVGQELRRVAIDPAGPAMLLVTSGSTAAPKLVIRTHRAIMHNVWAGSNGLDLRPEDRCGQASFPAYGAATTSTFNTLLSGATLVNLQVEGRSAEEVIEQMRSLRVSVTGLAAPLLRQILSALQDGAELPDLRRVRSLGQTLHAGLVADFRQKLGEQCVLLNGYASSETGGIAYGIVGKDLDISSGNIPLGRPVAGREVLILDEQGRPVEAGAMGQIAVRSRTISPGYWGDAELTAAHFLPDPDGSDKRIYLTGDLGRLRTDGVLEHHGRLAHSHKIRGYKVNLAEVERTLTILPQVAMACARVVPDPNGENLLVGYVVPSEDGPVTVTALRDQLAESVPDHLIPSQFVFLQRLPLLGNGKIDVEALPPPDRSRPLVAAPFVPPRTPVERAVAAVWCDVLNLESVGVDDDFFDLGGQSLRAAAVTTRLNQEMGAGLTVASLLNAPTVAGLAALLEEKGQRPDELTDEVLDDKLRLLGF